MAVLEPTVTSEGRVWPRVGLSVSELLLDVRRKLTDPFGVIISDDEITGALREVLGGAYPNYCEVHRYRYTWPDEDGTLMLPTTVTLPDYGGHVVFVKWEYDYGQVQLLSFSENNGTLVLRSLTPVQPGSLVVDIVEAPSSRSGTTSVPRRWITNQAAALLLNAWTQRTKQDRTLDKQEWLMAAAQEAMRSGGGPGIDAEGRYS